MDHERGPVLWKMVRSVLNPTRLRMLKLVYETEGRLCVRQISRTIGIAEPIASIYLRQMNEGGLINVQRQEIKVFYRPWPDCPWRGSLQFQTALAEWFKTAVQPDWDVSLMTCLRAFSHFNRLAILSRLTKGMAGLHDLKAAMGTCVKTLEHHLEFLYSADLIFVMHDQRHGYEIGLRRPDHPVSRTLLDILLDTLRSGADYRNVTEHHAIDSQSRHVLRAISKAENNLHGTWMRHSVMHPVKGYLPRSLQKAILEIETV